MMRWLLMLALFAGGLSAPAQDVAKETVRLPKPTAAPRQMEPPAAPDTRITLKPGHWLMIEATEEIEPVCSPEGVVTFVNERALVGGKPGPIHFAAPFADRDDTRPFAGFPADERRSYEREFVFSIKPAKTADCEVIVFVPSTKKSKRVKLTCIVDGNPDVPPGPTPTPKPDGASPFPGPGLHVLLVYDSAKTNRPAGELAVMNGTETMRDYLDAKCVVGPNPKEVDDRGQPMREWRIWPANADVSKARPVWREAFAKKGAGDWILIGDGKAGFSGPAPKTEAEMMTLLKKFGG